MKTCRRSLEWFFACALVAPAADLDWPNGCWRGTSASSEFEECWTGAAAGAKMGVFRIGAGGKTVLRVGLIIEETPSGLALTIQDLKKSLSDPPGLRGTFPVTRQSEREVVFENPKFPYPQRIFYRIEEDGALLVRLEGNRDGKPARTDYRIPRAASGGEDRFAWMRGCWRGVGKAGAYEECWTGASGGSRMGTMLMWRGPKITLREFILLEDRDAAPVMTVPHWQAGLASAGKAVSFTLGKHGARAATFENPAHDFPQRVVYERTSDDCCWRGSKGSRRGKQQASISR